MATDWKEGRGDRLDRPPRQSGTGQSDSTHTCGGPNHGAKERRRFGSWDRSHLKQAQRPAGRRRSRRRQALTSCCPHPGRLHQDNHLDDGQAEGADGPEDADGPGAADKLRLVEAGQVGQAWRR